MTYRELLQYLKIHATEEDLDMDVTVKDSVGEFYKADVILRVEDEECDILEYGHLYLE